MAVIDVLLREVVAKGGSDLHYVTGSKPMLRVNGLLSPIRDEVIPIEQGKAVLMELLSNIHRKRFEMDKDVDFAYQLPGVSRFRVAMFHQSRGYGAVFRVIPDKPIPLDDLGLPLSVKKFAELDRGLVLITGATGSGKSTTMAALIDIINQQGKKHIITIEDPIEFVHYNRGCLITQREVGLHTESFADALRAALREDPDLILVGEMRDLITTQLTLSAAETGIMVFATVHTNSAVKTIDRVVDVFPADEQDHVRIMLSVSLKGVISQQLLPTADGKGRIPAVELMFCNSAISNVIREGKTHQLTTLIQSSKKEGMQTMDQALYQLYKQGKITEEMVLSRASDRGYMIRAISSLS